MVEHLHRHLEATLTLHSNANQWIEFLMLEIGTTVNTDSSAKLVFGTTQRLPGEFIDPRTQRKSLT